MRLSSWLVSADLGIRTHGCDAKLKFAYLVLKLRLGATGVVELLLGLLPFFVPLPTEPFVPLGCLLQLGPEMFRLGRGSMRLVTNLGELGGVFV